VYEKRIEFLFFFFKKLADLGGSGSKEVINLLVDADCASQILYAANLSLDKVITVHGSWDRGCGHPCRHEL
jgi:hypothetical protein